MMGSNHGDADVLEPIAIPETENSFYNCLSYVFYDSFDMAASIREELWNYMTQKTLGCTLSQLRKNFVDMEVRIRDEVLDYPPIVEYTNNASLSRRPKPIRQVFQEKPHVAKQVSKSFATYVLQSSIATHAFPRIVGQVTADCYGCIIAIFQRSIRDPSQYVRVQKYKPSRYHHQGVSGRADSSSEQQQQQQHKEKRYIHLLWKEPFYSLLVLASIVERREQRGILKVPDKCSKTLYYDPTNGILPFDPKEHPERLEGAARMGKLGLTRGGGYIIQVFDPISRCVTRIAEVNTQRIMKDGPDCTIPIDSHVFRLPLEPGIIDERWIFGVQPKTEREKYKRIFIFVSKIDTPAVASSLSHWQRDFIEPHFYLARDDCCVYIVQAETINQAIEFMRDEANIKANPY